MAKELTRVGVVGLELTREEICDLIGNIGAVGAKAACREANCDVIDALADAEEKIKLAYNLITEILEE